ncbi:GDSL esterase/lipase [Hibiscus syriacus]|uniref:GDSL esterase/lipase n=1 Tax=Hibiscus syriacus TaxID=106335 RepID=A0A6A2XF55_HIBSY|nr:GDSL esterase/lipase [Hibiscus syriacus]
MVMVKAWSFIIFWANIPPNGIDFKVSGGNPTGRYTNGRTIGDIENNWEYRIMQFHNLLQILPGKLYFMVLGLDIQIDFFNNTRKQFDTLLGASKARDYISKRSIFSITIRANDFLNNYLLPVLSVGARISPDAFIDDMISHLRNQLTCMDWSPCKPNEIIGRHTLGATFVLYELWREDEALHAPCTSEEVSSMQWGASEHATGSKAQDKVAQRAWRPTRSPGVHGDLQGRPEGMATYKVARRAWRPMLGSCHARLYQLDARKFVVSNVGPIGCIPYQKTINQLNENECVDLANKLEIQYNGRLKDLLTETNGKLPGALFVHANVIYDGQQSLMWKWRPIRRDNPVRTDVEHVR